MKKTILGLTGLLALASCQNPGTTPNEKGQNATDSATTTADTLLLEGEKYLKNLRKLTDGGDNAEAYFSYDNRMAVFQSNYDQWGVECDQIFYFDLENNDLIREKPTMLSTGRGRTTCSFFMPGDTSILYASTHLQNDQCPPEPSREDGYVWPIYESFDIFVANLKGEIIDTLTQHPGYDAEATLSPQGDKIVFTSDRSGDLELWTMDIDGRNQTQITDALGYDGGAFFSPDGEWLVFRASRPQTEEARKEYLDLLADGLVKPTNMEIFICRTDGSELRQVTDLGNANWAPYFHPSGQKIIFSSNHASQRGFPFNLYLINIDGTGLEQVTFDEQFAAFPMFSYDGKKLLFSSNRFNGGTRHTNLFIADWHEE